MVRPPCPSWGLALSLAMVAAPAVAQVSFEPAQLWSSAAPGFVVPPQQPLGFAGRLGAALAVGDFDADGFEDLAIGDPSADPAGVVEAGAVYVLAGGPAGLHAPNVILSQASPGSPEPPEVATQLGGVLAAGDFNGDGADDLAVGLPSEHVGSALFAGAVQVLYGAAGRGLESEVMQLFTEDDFGDPWRSAEGDSMGQALAAADFDGDGFCDLAIGVPWEGLVEGLVHVLYGSPVGLTTAGMRSLHQDSVDVKYAMRDFREPNDRFGRGLAAGDFNGDGISDLAIGVPGEDEVINFPDGSVVRGAVAVVLGSPDGLTLVGNQLFRSNEPAFGMTFLEGRFGNSLAAGNFDGDAFTDLAIGVSASIPGSTGALVKFAGGVRILRGSPLGLTVLGTQEWTEQSPFVPEEAEDSDQFGQALATGDFDADGYADLGIGAPDESVGSTPRAGGAFLLFGGPGGLTAGTARYWTLGSRSIGGTVGRDEGFGRALAAGDFDGDGLHDLVIGAPADWVDGAARGSAVVLYRPGPAVPPVLQ